MQVYIVTGYEESCGPDSSIIVGVFSSMQKAAEVGNGIKNKLYDIKVESFELDAANLPESDTVQQSVQQAAERGFNS